MNEEEFYCLNSISSSLAEITEETRNIRSQLELLNKNLEVIAGVLKSFF